jgi:hypothetical protein
VQGERHIFERRLPVKGSGHDRLLAAALQASLPAPTSAITWALGTNNDVAT